MNNNIKTCLYDILNGIIEIESYFDEGFTKEFNLYQNDLKTKRAIERNIEIIGEAMNIILQSGEEISISNSRKIVDARNRIIQGYDTVSDDLIWGILVKHLPILKSEIEKLLND
ncbi:MAG: HepT-like ribonuclease domain-containing protein [Bacteroidota bacterium]